MLAATFGDAPKQERKRAKPDPAELVPTRRSARERKEVFYGDVPHTLPIASLIMTSIETLGERAAKGLPWPTLAQLVRPSLLEDPRLDQAFPAVRTATQSLLKRGKLRRTVLTNEAEQAEALALPVGSPRRTMVALRSIVLRAIQVPPQARGAWDVPMSEELSEEEEAQWRAEADSKQTQKLAALEQRLRENAEQSLMTEAAIQQEVHHARQQQPLPKREPWLPRPDKMPELSGGAAATSGAADGGDDDDDDEDWDERGGQGRHDPEQDVDTTPGARVELMVSMSTIRNRVRRKCETDAIFFGVPPGWARVPDEGRTGRRRTQMVYSRLPDDAMQESDNEEEEEDMDLNRHTMTKVIKMMRELKCCECAWAFLEPVAVAQVPGYAEAIETPMDLGTVQTKLDQSQYTTLNQIATDLRLIPANCLKFNKGSSGAEEFVQAALGLERQVERQLAIVRGADEDAGASLRQKAPRVSD